MNGINSNYNSISTLFGSLGTNNMMGSFNFSDYASIKNGSYSKIVKAYYAGPVEKAPTSNKTETDKTSTNNKIKEISADTSDLTQMKKKADRLSVAADDLNKSGLYNTGSEKYDRNAITDAVKKFADEYNSVVKQSSKVASKEITGAVNSMKSMTTTMNKALEKIGVNVQNDGTLKVNEDKLGSADVKSIKALFSGEGTYGSQIAGNADSISKDAVMNSRLYNSDGSASSMLSGMFNGLI